MSNINSSESEFDTDTETNSVSDTDINKLSLLDEYLMNSSSDYSESDDTNTDDEPEYENDETKGQGCFVCKRMDVDTDCVCCDCSVNMCNKCASHDGLDNYKYMCGCYGRGTNCKKKVDRCENSWPCHKCDGWYCSVKCMRTSSCQECLDDISESQEKYENKRDLLKLQENVNFLMRKHYELVIWQACKNIEYYIIKKITNYDDNKMSTIDINLINFFENKKYQHEIIELMKNFKMRYYINHINKLLINKEKYTPKKIDILLLHNACDELEYIYNDIDILADRYSIIEDYFN
jgi:hypothetical protein